MRRDSALMPTRRRHMDWRGRRQDLGATIKEMEAGRRSWTGFLTSEVPIQTQARMRRDRLR